MPAQKTDLKKKRQQILRATKMPKNDKLLEKEGNLYMPGGF